MVKYISVGLAILAGAASVLAVEPAAPPDLNEARVTLPYPEVKALWQASQRETPKKRKPPVEATLLSARYQLQFKGDLVAGIVEYEIETFTDEWTTVSLLGAQTQVDEVEPADVQLIVRNDHYAFVTDRRGRQKLRLKFAVKLNGAADGAHFALAASPATINTLAVSGLPEKQTLRIADATQLSAEKDRASFRLPAQEKIEFELVPEKAVVPPTPSRWKLDTQDLVQFTEVRLNFFFNDTATTENG